MLTRGSTKSCGCYSHGIFKKNVTKHGMKGTRFYSIWRNMHSRCENQKAINYNIYGGRGISVCKRWFKFLNFKTDMYQEYLEHVATYGESNTQIDRIDNNSGYSKTNCQWATRSSQCSNRSRNHLFEVNGKKMTLVGLAKLSGRNYSDLYYNLIRRKKPVAFYIS